MGDRGNIVVHEEVKDEDRTIYLYTHWGGSEIKKDLQEVLSRKERWDDAPYLTRMIFCKMVGKDSFDGETGFGISTCICDNEHNLMHVYPEKKIVKEITEGGKTVNKWTFDKYLEAIFKDEED